MATQNGSCVRLQFTPSERDLGEYCFDTFLSLLNLRSDLWLCSFLLILTIWSSFKLGEKKFNATFIVLKGSKFKIVVKDLRHRHFILIDIQSG